MDAIILNQQLNCSAHEAFQYWTDPKLMGQFFGVDHKVSLEKEGPYEIYFSLNEPIGVRGSEGCQIIDFEIGKSLSFTWNAPPSIPSVRNSGLYTRVDVDFHKINDHSCELKLSHKGWMYEGKDWEQTHKYFQQAWPYVLNLLEEAINKENSK